MWSDVITREDRATWKQPEENTWVRRAAEKYTEFDLYKEKETFMEVKKIFVDSGASTSKNQNARIEKPEEVIVA